MPLLTANKVQAMTENISESYVKGKWVRVPALDVDGEIIAVRGTWLKVAIVRSEEWLETEMENPDGCIKELKRKRPSGERAAILTCTLQLPGPQLEYQYPMACYCVG